MVITLVLLMLVAGLGGAVSQAQAAPPDATSPAGTVTGAIVVFSPVSVLLLTPTPATGSLMVPLRVPPASGLGPALTQLQIVIPGPNPAQNTTIGLSATLELAARVHAGGRKSRGVCDRDTGAAPGQRLHNPAEMTSAEFYSAAGAAIMAERWISS